MNTYHELFENLPPPERQQLQESLRRVDFPLVTALFQAYQQQAAAGRVRA